MKNKAINKAKINDLLQDYGDELTMSGKAPTKGSGMLDVPKLNEMRETKVLIEALKKEGVRDTAHLSELGLWAAAMVIEF